MQTNKERGKKATSTAQFRTDSRKNACRGREMGAGDVDLSTRPPVRANKREQS